MKILLYAVLGVLGSFHDKPSCKPRCKASRLYAHSARAWYSRYSMVRGRALLRYTVCSVYMLFNTRNVQYMNIRTFLWLA
jgi:hypothetical protein